LVGFFAELYSLIFQKIELFSAGISSFKAKNQSHDLPRTNRNDDHSNATSVPLSAVIKDLTIYVTSGNKINEHYL
jgi:hypothetical protein